MTILPIAEALRLLDKGFRRERGVEDETLFLGREVDMGEVMVVGLGVEDEGGADLSVVGPDMALMI